MATNQEALDRAEDDPSTAADALSLHTIADTDAYTLASQEQEDADFALALALEEQENERYARTQRVLQGQDSNQVGAEPQTHVEAQVEVPPPPYRDDPDAVDADDNLPPYRDDPDAVPVEGGADETTTAPVKRHRAILRVLQKLFKTWLCCLMISTIATIVIIVVVLVLVFVYGKTPSRETSKQAAWEASGSFDYNLKLPKLYPTLEQGTNSTCRSAWERIYGRSLSCHRMILSSAWDDGNADEVNAAEANPFFYSEAVCTSQCLKDINFMKQLAQSCTKRTDRFDFATYGNNGKAYFEKGKIEEGPVHVVKSLAQRYDRLCHRKVTFGQTDWGTCAADLWMNWGVVDGQNEAHLNGIDQFLKQTSVKKTIPGGIQNIPVLSRTGANTTSPVRVRPRKVGPGEGDTDCSVCTLDWLERKMRSFEFGQILDPATGEALGLSEFREKLRHALFRCNSNRARAVLGRVELKWEMLRWWCGNKPCNLDKPTFSNQTMAVLHGWPKDNEVLVRIRGLLEKKEAPGKVLQAIQVLYDGLRDMPCGYGFDPIIAIREIIPHEHIVARLCSDQCRNALDRLRQQHSALFSEASRDRKYGGLFHYLTAASNMVDRVCLSTSLYATIGTSEHLCAPGYAALGWPEWIFAGDYGGYADPPTRAQILDVFSRGIDELDVHLSKHPISCFRNDADCIRTRSKLIAESACNTCAGKLFIGADGTWKKTAEEFLNDKDINGTEYVAAAKKGWRTCAKMYDIHLTKDQWQKKWRECGLDRYD